MSTYISAVMNGCSHHFEKQWPALLLGDSAVILFFGASISSSKRKKHPKTYQNIFKNRGEKRKEAAERLLDSTLISAPSEGTDLAKGFCV